jgi:hypothetical protein
MNNYMPNCIQKLVIELSSHRQVDNRILNDIVSGISFIEKELEPYFFYDHAVTESYGRRLIWQDKNFKILLMSWRPGDYTAIHNHGKTEWGSVHFLGDATHRLYDFDNGQLNIAESSEFIAGQNASVCGDLIHLMGNSGSRNVATLHIYGMNIPTSEQPSKARVYLPELKKVVFTDGSAFLNMCPTLTLGEDWFTNISPETLIDYLQLVIPFYERNKCDQTISFIEEILQNPELYYQQKELT